MANQRGSLALWLALAVGGGATWAAQFGPRGFLVAPWLALAPLLLLLGSPWPARLGFLHGVVFWLAGIPWIAPTLVTYGQLPVWLSWLLFVLLAAFLALYWAAFAGLGARLWRRGGWVALLGLPALWVTLELVRGWLFSGFPWNVANYAWVDVPGALPLASWVGPWGISFLVVLTNGGVASAIARRRWQTGALALLVPLILLPLAGRFAHGAARPGPPQAVRLLQPNIANLVHYEPLPALRNYARVLAMSRQACDEPGALVIWPESAGWPFDYPRDANLRQDVWNLVDLGCPLLFNSAVEEKGRWYNAAFLLTPGGGEGRYDKRHLVPFGEYVPAKALFPFIDSLARNAGDFTAAKDVTLLPWGSERLGVAICFEVIFPGEVAEAVRQGATSLVTITNDAWYGDTSAPWQHFRAVRFRAAEERRPFVRAAITGISALVRADGSVAALLGPFEQGVLRGELRGAVGLSPYARRPWLGQVLAVVLAAAALLAGWRAKATRSEIKEPRSE
ncbi:MAG TPA: apolipoprotein N-acyltransferase [Thermoanaerobaculia bacterium]|nr:apolipoprotein N-acyltransferase [Thermoanaerobaculia bacterium]